jgi:hypothetical protein
MPTMKNYLNFVYVNLGFVAQVTIMMYFKSLKEIKDNWPVYRCNPPYWFFSDNISEDFTYCVQNSQMNMMGYLLEPLNYMVSSLGSLGGMFNDSIDKIRGVFDFVRSFVSEIVQNVFGVFLNITVELQKTTISIKDMVGKMIALVTTIMYILDGSIKTMNSAWSGPPGQIVKAIGSCFHPDTKIKLKNGEIYAMKDLPLGAELEDGAKVFSVMKIANPNNEALYKINVGVTNEEAIYVTGDHFVLDKEMNTWIQVKNYKNASKQEEIKSDWFSCLITTNRRISIGKQLFWDWEDDILTQRLVNI